MVGRKGNNEEKENKWNKSKWVVGRSRFGRDAQNVHEQVEAMKKAQTWTD